MIRLMIQAALFLCFCTLLVAQQPTQAASTPATEQSALPVQQAADVPQSSAIAERNLAIKNARTISIKSETVYLTASTMDRALMKQKNWEKLGLNIVQFLLCRPGTPNQQARLHAYPHVRPHRQGDQHRSRLGQGQGLRRSGCLWPHGRADREDTGCGPAACAASEQ